MQKWLKKLIIVAMTAALSLPLLSAGAYKGIDSEQGQAAVSASSVYRNEKRVSVHPYPAKSDRGAGSGKTAPELPAYYNSYELGYISPVRHQGRYGTCWAHGAIAACEANMVKKGIPLGGASAQASSINLSEYHLAYFSYTDSYDALDLTKGDKSITTDVYYNAGGNGEIASYTLMRWEGLASESTPALVYSRIGSGALDSAYAYGENVAHVQDCTWIPACDISDVKRAIMEYGAGTIGYYHNDTYYDSSSYAYCCIQRPYEDESNHDVTVVGWDDSFSKEFFSSSSRPENNGAWIVKGSYGALYGDDGYYYLSYEDTAMLKDYCYFYAVEPVDNYDYNYQYDGTGNTVNGLSVDSGVKVMNVFTATGRQTVDAAAFCTWTPGVSYTCDIYTGLPADGSALPGTPAASVSGTFPYMGYHTVKLDTPVPVDSGERFAVVFTLTSQSGRLYVPLDCSGSDRWITWTHAAHAGTSFYQTAGRNDWVDAGPANSLRIKAYAKGDSGSVAARSVNDTYGTVNVMNKVIYATPAAGYKADGYRVISGQATVTQNGNLFRVETSVDCVIEILFAPITYTVKFEAPSPVPSVYVNAYGTVTVPSYENTAYGSTHVGWTRTKTEQATTTPPDYYAPGCTVTIAAADVTLYALFSYPSPSDTTVTLYSTHEGPCPHTPSEWIVDAAATFDTAGERHRVCTVCAAVLPTEIIPKLTWVNPFRDVAGNTWYYKAVRYVNYYGYIKGTNDGSSFEPDTVTTRAMFVNILYRLEKDPATHENRFTDVPNGAWYEPGISWAAGEGVVNGTSPAAFSPNSSLDRQQMATMLYNYARYKGQNLDATGDYTEFRDGADVDDWAQTAINWALGRRLISGTSETEKILKPNGQATRATIAVIMMKFLTA